MKGCGEIKCVCCCNINERNGIACLETEGCEEGSIQGRMALCREERNERHIFCRLIGTGS
jgi:hypothetical protein